MSRRPGVISKIWTNFRNSLAAPLQKVHFVGEDHLGNQYYLKDAARNLKGGRWIEARDKNQFTPPEVPIEWEAWLRGRRDDPPTQEELDKNYVTMMKTIYRAKELESRDSQGMDELSDSPESGAQGIGKTITAGNKNKVKFPIFEGMEVTPGVKQTR